MKSLISVIIPTYNRAAFLERALTSVARQTYKNWQVIVVDDGSTDTTFELIQNLQKKWQLDGLWQKLEYVKQDPLGVGAARNKGASLAQGEWLAFLDSDDEWLPEKLQWQIDLAEENPQWPLIHSEEIWLRQGVRVNPTKKYKKQGGWVFTQSLLQCCISSSTVLIRKEFFEKLSGFREDFPVCEDYDLWLKISLKNPVGFVERPAVIKYAGHPDQLSQSIKAMDYYRVLAIDGILNEDFPHNEWRTEAQRTLQKKCAVLLNGYVKHDNMKNYAEVLKIKERWL